MLWIAYDGAMVAAPQEIITPRARLRRLCEDDFPAFARMNADTDVMRYFPRTWTEEESRAAFERVNVEFEERGFGVYALERHGQLRGVAGLSVPSFEAWFTPCIEILWRLLPEFWGRGLATEAAKAVLQMADESLRLQKVFAFAVMQNKASIRVMEKVGMAPCDPPSFLHPQANDSRLKEHLLYSIRLRSAVP